MNARELRDATEDFIEKGVNRLCYDEEYGQTILRALDLLARVEESEDELVRELREARDTYDGYGGTSGHLLHRAAARIVALKAENDAMRHDIDRAMEACKDHLYQLAAVEAERDRLKAHAEAMHDKGKRIVNGHCQVAAIEAMEAAITAYRRDHPKEEA